MKKVSTTPASIKRRTRRLSEAEIIARAESDPDCPPTTVDETRFRRVSLARRVRQRLGLSQPAFARTFGIALGTLRDWEQHRVVPDKTARSYLEVIARDPDAVKKAREMA